MTKKYILLFDDVNELDTKIYTHEEVEELHNASHYYYETYVYPTFTYGETKEETIQRALDYHSYTDINQLLERNGCETFEEFKELLKLHQDIKSGRVSVVRHRKPKEVRN
jgi:hypothetical protein